MPPTRSLAPQIAAQQIAAQQVATQQIATIRDFNRFYTARLGLLRKRHLDGVFSLTEARILYEIAAYPGLTASTLRSTLELDRGYISRTLASLARRRLLRQRASSADAREKQLSLTPLGEKAAARLDQQSSQQMETLLGALTSDDRRTVAASLATVRAILGSRSPQGTISSTRASLIPATPQQDHLRIERLARATSAARAILDEYYEAVHVVARDRPGTIQQLIDDPDNGMWLARLGRQIVGCVVLRSLPHQAGEPGNRGECKRLYVRPAARGRGIAAALLDALEDHARRRGTQWIYLDSYDDLKPAIALYRKRGYRPCPRYNDNPQATLFLRKKLT